MFKSSFLKLIKNKVSKFGNHYYSSDYDYSSEYDELDSEEYYEIIMTTLIALLIGFFAIEKLFTVPAVQQTKIWVYILIALYPQVAIVLWVFAYMLNLTITKTSSS